VFNNSLPAAKLLIDNGANTNLQNDTGETPLWPTVLKNYSEMARLLIEHGADVNLTNNRGITLLILAALIDNKEAVELLLENGADINHLSTFGLSPLVVTVQKNHLELAELLINRGAQINLKDAMGSTALLWSLIEERVDMLKLLIANNAEVDLDDSRMVDVLDHVQSIEIRRILMDAARAQGPQPVDVPDGNFLIEGALAISLGVDFLPIPGKFRSSGDGSRTEATELQSTSCSGPSCGKTEVEGGSRLLTCTGCRISRYCSTKCQRSDWSDHKRMCRKANRNKSAAV